MIAASDFGCIIYAIVPRFKAFCALIAIAAGTQLNGQTAPLRIGPGVTAPRLLRKVEPEFSPLARAENVHGKVVVQLVVTEKGRAGNIQVISPLGYGLDENAIAAIQKWEFAPGQKDGLAVSVSATVEVSFRFLGTAFDETYERRRTEFNVALQTLRRVEPDARERAMASMVKLSQQNFPGALYVAGLWEVTGEVAPAVVQNPEAGWTKIQQAAKKNFGPAIYRLAKRSIDDSASNEKTWDNMRRAALLGSRDAQFFLGDRHQRGEGVERSLDRAKHYFRLCAAGGVPQCQERLGHLMFDSSDRPDYEYEQALAWFSLAADRGIASAREIVERENSNLTPAQSRRIATLKRQFAGTSD